MLTLRVAQCIFRESMEKPPSFTMQDSEYKELFGRFLQHFCCGGDRDLRGGGNKRKGKRGSWAFPRVYLSPFNKWSFKKHILPKNSKNNTTCRVMLSKAEEVIFSLPSATSISLSLTSMCVSVPQLCPSVAQLFWGKTKGNSDVGNSLSLHNLNWPIEKYGW